MTLKSRILVRRGEAQKSQKVISSPPPPPPPPHVFLIPTDPVARRQCQPEADNHHKSG